MQKPAKFEPSNLKVMALTSHQALGRAVRVMLLAVGFGTVVVAKPTDACLQAKEIKPDFIIFTQEYLSCSMEKKMAIGNPNDWCDDALVLVLLKQKTVENVLMSKSMGFGGIIFADASVEKMYRSIEKVYLRYQSI